MAPSPPFEPGAALQRPAGVPPRGVAWRGTKGSRWTRTAGRCAVRAACGGRYQSGSPLRRPARPRRGRDRRDRGEGLEPGMASSSNNSSPCRPRAARAGAAADSAADATHTATAQRAAPRTSAGSVAADRRTRSFGTCRLAQRLPSWYWPPAAPRHARHGAASGGQARMQRDRDGLPQSSLVEPRPACWFGLCHERQGRGTHARHS